MEVFWNTLWLLSAQQQFESTKERNMAAQRFEYKVVYVDFRGRVSVEGDETTIQDGERMTALAAGC